jgi:succinyl-diaminopimelate desuccinylase
MSALVLALDGYKKILAKKKFRTPEGKVMVPTLNLGGVFASGEGGKINTVPAGAVFSIDRRLLPVETVAAAERDLRAFLKKAAAQIPQCRITIEKVSDNHPSFSPPVSPFAAALRRSVARVRRRPAKFCVSTGFNDMHFFANELRLPTLGYGPGGQNYHAVDERAKIKDLVEAAAIYTDLLTTFAG